MPLLAIATVARDGRHQRRAQVPSIVALMTLDVGLPIFNEAKERWVQAG